MKEMIRGIIPPIVTPMNVDESINECNLRKLIRRLLNAGVHGIFALGTNGEGYILNEKEKEQVLAVVIDEVKGQVPVYAGTGCVSTQETIRTSKMAQDMGVDVISVITPSFAKASQEELIEHYTAIAAAVSLPIVLYNIPARTGNTLLPRTVEKLAEIDNIVGAKDSSGSFDNMLQYIELTKEKDFAVLSGNDSLILWNLLAGGTGGIAGCANVFPINMVNIYEYFVAGNILKAKEYQDNIRSFRECFQYGNPNTIIKAAVDMQGITVGRCRRPFHLIPEEGIRAIQNVLREHEDKGYGSGRIERWREGQS